MVLLSKSSVASKGAVTKPRSKTLPRHFTTKQPSADVASNKPTKKTPPPPIPSRPPLVMQYQNKSVDGLTSQSRRSQSNSISSHSSTPSIPEESTTPPSSPKLVPPLSSSPELCTPETKQLEQAEGTTKLTPEQLSSDDVFQEASPKGQSSPTSKGKKKFLSGFKSTFRRRPKSAGEEKSMTLNPGMNREHIIITHRRAKTVKNEVLSESRGINYIITCDIA